MVRTCNCRGCEALRRLKAAVEPSEREAVIKEITGLVLEAEDRLTALLGSDAPDCLSLSALEARVIRDAERIGIPLWELANRFTQACEMRQVQQLEAALKNGQLGELLSAEMEAAAAYGRQQPASSELPDEAAAQLEAAMVGAARGKVTVH